MACLLTTYAEIRGYLIIAQIQPHFWRKAMLTLNIPQSTWSLFSALRLIRSRPPESLQNRFLMYFLMNIINPAEFYHLSPYHIILLYRCLIYH